MSSRSHISRLPKAIRQQVDICIANGVTINEIVSHLKNLGHDVSRSSVGRYSKKSKADIMAKIKDQLDLTAAWGEGLGIDEENHQDRQILSMLRYLVADYQARAIHEDTPVEPKEMRALGQAMKDIILSRAKLEDIRKLAKAEALADMEKVAKADKKKKPLEIVAELKKGYGVE